jgi:hypothetical protein
MRLTVFAESAESGVVAKLFAQALKDKPVATARLVPEEGEEVPIVVVARADAMRLLKVHPDQGGEFEMMLARFLEEVVHATIGASLDDEIFRSKVKDLLMQVCR